MRIPSAALRGRRHAIEEADGLFERIALALIAGKRSVPPEHPAQLDRDRKKALRLGSVDEMGRYVVSVVNRPEFLVVAGSSPLPVGTKDRRPASTTIT